MQPLSKPPSLNIAHRGGANLLPENTLAAFANAIALGADGIECDIQRTRDGEIVITHDLHLNPAIARRDGVYLTAPTPAITALTYRQLQAYDVGRVNPDTDYAHHRAQQTPRDGAPIPLFSELCALIAARAPTDFQIFTEMKTALSDDPREGTKLVNTLCQLLDTDKTVKACAPQMTFISFDWRCLAHLRATRPACAIGHLTLPFAITDPQRDLPQNYKIQNIDVRGLRNASANGAPWWHEYDWRQQTGATHAEKVLRAIKQAGGTKWFAFWRDINDATCAWADDLNLEIAAWTVNDAATMRALRDRRLAAIITDNPDMFATLD